MLDFTNIDAIQFLQNGVNNFRVYYQNADNTIRESCFDDKRKWYTTGNVIARDAKENSPIAVTRWNGGTEVISSSFECSHGVLHSLISNNNMADPSVLFEHR